MNRQADILIIVGNGFDLANNFKTSYKDFVQNKLFTTLVPKNALAKHIQDIVQIQKWVDLEMELANYSNTLWEQYKHHIPKSINVLFEKEFNEIRDALFHYILEVQQASISNPSLEHLIQDWLNELCEDKRAYILCFNYNMVDYRFFSKDTAYQQHFVGGNPNQVHGIASPNKGNRIVLGVDKTNIQCKEHSFIIKEYNENTNDNGYFESIGSVSKIIIFGCSLGNTDYRYFKPLFTDVSGKTFNIYCHGENEYRTIKQNIQSYSNDYMSLIQKNKIHFFDSSKKSFDEFKETT